MTIKTNILTKFADSFEKIKPFKKNTLSYVGIAFQFDNIINFDDNQPIFYSRVRDKLPYKIERPASEGSLMLTISPERNQVGFSQQSESFTEYIYTDNKDKPTIRVITNKKKIDFQCIDPENNYLSFKKFYDDIMEIFTSFCNVYEHKLNLMEVVLRKINKIELDENVKYLNQSLLFELGMFDNFTNTNTYKEFSTIGNVGETIEFRSGIIKNKPESDKNLIIYDFTIRQDNPNVLKLDKDDLKNMLQDFSMKIYNLYCYCVSESYIKKVLNNE